MTLLLLAGYVATGVSTLPLTQRQIATITPCEQQFFKIAEQVRGEAEVLVTENNLLNAKEFCSITLNPKRT